jgi:hypothetical protein
VTRVTVLVHVRKTIRDVEPTGERVEALCDDVKIEMISHDRNKSKDKRY